MGHLGSDGAARKLESMMPALLKKRITLQNDAIDTLALIDSDVARALLYVRGFESHYADTKARIRSHLEAGARCLGITYAAIEDRILHTLAREPERDVFFERLLESMLRDERDWLLADFRSLFVDEPSLRLLAKRLVWEAGGKIFRIDDGSFADSADRALVLGPKARIRLAHPIAVARSSWEAMKRIFADYEIIQPFAQLDRETFTKLAECKQTKKRVVPWSSIDAMLGGRDWIRPPAQGAMVKKLIFPLERLEEHAALELAISPGLTFGAVKNRPKQTSGSLALRKVEESDLPPLLLSELVRDVTTLRALG